MPQVVRSDRGKRLVGLLALLPRRTEPHIIPIHEAGEIGGRLYLVMPVIDGIAQGTLRPVRLVRVAGISGFEPPRATLARTKPNAPSSHPGGFAALAYSLR